MTEIKTVGQEAYDRLLKPDTGQGIVDTQREADKAYFEEMEKVIKQLGWTEPYYIVVHVKKEQLMQNVIRRYFIGRKSLPTPQWDQTVWRFYPKTGNCEFVWCLPDENTGAYLASHPTGVQPEDEQLRQFVLDFLDDKLYRFYLNKFHKGIEPCEEPSQSEYAPFLQAAKGMSDSSAEQL